MNFDVLIQSIADIHKRSHTSATKAVNMALTARNWLIGAYIHEYELRGEDRADYGEQLVGRLAEALFALKVPACERRRLYSFLAFYRAYPQIQETMSSELLGSGTGQIFRSLAGKLTVSEKLQGSQIVRSLTAQFQLSGKLLLERLSFTHLELLSDISEPLKRGFYEVECIKGNWSVREPKRQIGSLYFERSGLSKDKEKLSRLANEHAPQAEPQHVIRDPYVFDFLGIRPSEVLPESGLEAALIEKLQSFLLELGYGFCFEARQKRLLIGGKYFFVDLVFYHRVLKCHVLVDLKVAAFTHEQLGQLNTYVSYYRAHEMTTGDQPPVGILLCTDKNQALVEYALAGMDNRLFVSKYQLELPQPEVLQNYLSEQRKQLEAKAP
jgi:predicted nuclease of restriction endonuclease-like (RecB) superfamily